MSLETIKAALEQHLDSLTQIIPAATIQSNTTGIKAVFTTASSHGLVNGLLVKIVGCDAITDGVYFVADKTANTFTLQNTATKSPIGATIAATDGTVQACLTAGQNQDFSPVMGVPYQQIDLIPARPFEPTQGGGFSQELGLFQVTLKYPLAIGSGAMVQRAEVIRSGFKKGLDLQLNGITVTITNKPDFGAFFTDVDRYCLPVKIRYKADIYE